MGYSIRTFLITPDDVIRKIGMTRYWNMLVTPDSDCLPEFAAQRVRLANLTIELVDRKPVHVINRDFVIVTFDAQGRLYVGQIMQRGSSLFEVFMASNLGRYDKKGTAKVVDATARFTVQGSQWTPTRALSQALDEAALGLRRCPGI
jgi:hypothetical protein